MFKRQVLALSLISMLGVCSISGWAGEKEVTKSESYRQARQTLNDIRKQINSAYTASFNKSKDSSHALDSVRNLIEADLEFMEPSLRDAVREDCEEIISGLKKGQTIDFQESTVALLAKSLRVGHHADQNLKLKENLKSFDLTQGQVEYTTKAELVQALVSSLESDRWVSTSNISTKTAKSTTTKEKFSAQVSISFMGVKFSGGPQLEFSRDYTTYALIMAEGLNPVFDANGIFDRYKRDQFGNIVKVKGVPQKRYIFFVCDAEATVSSETVIGGGLSVVGVGGEASYTTSYKNSVTLESRRLVVPEYIDNKQVTVRTLSDLCHKDFLYAKVGAKSSVKGNLNLMLNNLVSGLTYVSQATKCVVDKHCENWYNYEVVGLHKFKTYPRCIQESNQPGYFHCRLRGLEGANCSVYNQEGKRVSSGSFEYLCDTGLKCTITHKGGWFQNYEIWDPYVAKCKPINPKHYISPLQRYNEIEVTVE